MERLSVIICTFNPNRIIFQKCLRCISEASNYFKPHEVIIIDNNSSDPLIEQDYVNNFLKNSSNVKVIRESIQGLISARLRGIRESSGDLIIFVDDDNFIDKNYFLVAADIFIKYPYIGAFSGQVTLEYDKEPEEWTKKYWGMLIHRKLDENLWSNLPFNNDTMPNGAGLCVSRDVAGHYIKFFNDGARPFNLDRSKDSLMSGGDNDLAMCACDIGKGMGLFKDLHLRHYIPPERFTLKYLSKLAYGIYFSYVMLFFMRKGKVHEDTFKQKLKHLLSISVMKKNDRIIQHSCKKGLNDAITLVKNKHLDL